VGFVQKVCVDVDWIPLVQDMVQWHDFVNTVLNLQVPQKVENFLII
jgi:hypothetical protein